MVFENSSESNFTFNNILSKLPVIYIISLLIFYLHTTLIIGHLPIYSLDDPKNLSIYNFYAPIILISSSANFFCFLIWLLPSIAYNLIKKNKIIWKPILINLLLQTIAVFLLFSEISIWFGD
jgi:hypothetical protein